MGKHRNFLRQVVAAAVAPLVVAAGLAGCGGDEVGVEQDPASSARSAGALRHVDGSIVIQAGGEMTVTRADGTSVTLEVGPAVEQGPLRGLATSNEKARVYYAEAKKHEDLVAASVEAAPRLEKGTKTYEGIVVETTKSSIVVGGNEGDRTFTVRAADRERFDLEHLAEHRESAAPIRVLYRNEDGADRATAYEDA